VRSRQPPTHPSRSLRNRLRGLRHGADRWVLLLGFFTLIALPTVFFNRSFDADRSLKENRQLAEFPKPSLFFLQKMERWYQDHFGGRSDLTYLGARLQMTTLGFPANRQVLLGQDQWLFYDQHYKPGKAYFADYRGLERFSEAQLNQIRNNLVQTQQALARCGVAFYAVMAPDKQTVYPDKMPFAPSTAGPTKLDQLMAALRQVPDLHVLDLRPVLKQARDMEAHDVYFQTDTHWNALGAFHAVNALLQTLRGQGWAVTGLKRQEWEVTARPFAGGDIAVSMLSLPHYFADTEWVMSPRPDASAQKPAGAPRLLLYGDSFSEAMQPFLDAQMGHVTVIRRAHVDGQELQLHQPQVVVVEVLERLLNGWLSPPVNLGLCPSVVADPKRAP